MAVGRFPERAAARRGLAARRFPGRAAARRGLAVRRFLGRAAAAPGFFRDRFGVARVRPVRFERAIAPPSVTYHDDVIVRLVAVIALGGLGAGAFTAPRVERWQPGAPLILVSLDGWRWDYHTKARVPNLRALIARGVHAEALIPVFPSKTFPNHYTQVTGLYP